MVGWFLSVLKGVVLVSLSHHYGPEVSVSLMAVFAEGLITGFKQRPLCVATVRLFPLGHSSLIAMLSS